MTQGERLNRLVATAREVAEQVIAPTAEAEDRDAIWPASAMRALADAGLMGLNVPAAQGGHGEGLRALVAVCETLADASASTALCFGMHCVGSAVISARATDWQKQAYLEPIARGEHITTLALSEPGTGSYFYVPETTAETREGGYRLTGSKSFVTNGGEADSYVVSTRANGRAEGGDGSFTCFVVDGTSPELEWTDAWRGMGMRGNSSRTARLEGIPVDGRHLLGREGDHLWYVFEVIAPYFLMAMAGTYTGLAAAAVDVAREHLASRRHSHSGELLGNEPVVAHRLGELWVEVERTRRLVYSAAERADAGDADALPAVLGAKAAAGDTAVRAANEAMTLCGGMAYRADARLARILRDARAAHVMSPTTDALKTWVGRSLLGLPLL